MSGREKFFLNKTGPSMVVQKVRLKFERKGPASGLSHLQQIDAVRKTIIKAGWPVVMSNAKKSKPKASFGPAIALGYESVAELADMDLSARLDFKDALEKLNSQFTEGFRGVEVKSVPRFFPSIEESANLIEYEVHSTLLAGTEKKWESFWNASQFIVIKKKAEKDLAIDARECVHSWRLSGEKLNLKLRMVPRKTLKPERIIQAVLDLKEEEVEIVYPPKNLMIMRTNLYFEKSSGELVQL